MKNIKKFARSVLWFFELSRMVCALNVILAALYLGGLWLYYLTIDTLFMGSTGLTLGNVLFHFADAYLPPMGSSVALATVEYVTMAVTGVIGYFLHDSICNILEPMKAGSPFQHEVVTGTHRLAWLTVGMGAANAVSQTVKYVLERQIYDLEALFLSEKITHVSRALALDFDFILYAAVLFLLSWIFRHGEELQQLSDETL